MKQFLAAAALVCLLATGVSAEVPGSLADTARALRGTTISEFDSIPAETRALLQQLKSQARAALLTRINTTPDTATPAVLRNILLADLQKSAGGARRGFASIIDLQVARPAGHNGRLLMRLSLAIGCGNDTSVMLLRKDNGRWAYEVIYDRSDYEAIDEVPGVIGAELSPPRADGSFYLFVAEIAMTCNAHWGDLRYLVLGPGPTPEAPLVLLDQKARAVATQRKPRWRTLADSLLVEFAGDSYDAMIRARTRVARYELAGGTPRRVDPLGLRPHDFVDEWLRLPWSEAGRWLTDSAAKQSQELAKVHRSLANETGRYRFVQPCGSGKQFDWQLAFELTDGRGSVYFSLRQHGSNEFKIAAVGSTRPPGCPGSGYPTFTALPSLFTGEPAIRRPEAKPDLDILKPQADPEVLKSKP